MAPLVSIVTPSYNQGKFIRATIESVLSQDYPHIEYIVMDGGSTDDTASLVKDYASRLTWISEKDRGQSHAINKGFRMAKGEIVAWLNSDDIILPGAVSHAVRTFTQRPEFGAVYGEGYLLDYQGNITGRFPYTEPFNLWKLMHLSDYILQQSTYFRKSVVEEVGYLDERLHYAMDWDLLIRIGKRYVLGYIPEFMGCIREYPYAKSSCGGGRRVKEIVGVLRRNSGALVPPGCLVYGLETYSRLLCAQIDRTAPRFMRAPSERLKKMITVAAGWWIGKAVQESQGWYPDGWASPHVKYMLPARRGTVRVCGTLPDNAPTLRGQSIRVNCARKIVAREPIAFGDFQLTFPVTPMPADDPVKLELRASRFWSPCESNGAAHRRVAYILKGVDLV